MTMRNTGDTSLEVDVYEIEFNTDNATNGNPIATFLDAETGTGIIPGTSGSGITITTRGATPFELPQALSADKMKIMKKRKYFLPAGNTSTLQYRDPANFQINTPNLRRLGGYALRRKTHCFFFVIKNVVGVSTTGNFACGVTRKYSYCVDAFQTPFDAVFS